MTQEDSQTAGLGAAQRARLLQHLRQKNVARARQQAIPRADLQGPVLASFAQQRLWFLHQLAPDDLAYNWPASVRCTGPLQPDRLQHSLSLLIARHAILRTTFGTVDGQPVQIIAPPAPLSLPVVSLDHLTPAEQEAEVQRRVSAAARQPFDLAAGPLLRAQLLRLSPNDHVLVLFLHHIISDGWSASILLRDTLAVYQALANGQSAETVLPELPIQYADYALWQRQMLQGAGRERLLSYWQQQLRPDGSGPLPRLELPTDYPRPAQRRSDGAASRFLVPAATIDALRQLMAEHDATLFMGLLSVWVALLCRYTGQHDLLVGTPIAGRTRPEVANLIGFFANTLVLRLNLSGTPTFRELLAQVRQVCLAAYDHQDLPFEQIVEMLPVERAATETPVFQVVFALDNTDELAFEIPGLSLQEVSTPATAVPFDLMLTFRETTEAGIGNLLYRTDLFAAATIERQIGHLLTLLEAVLADPDRRLSELPLLTAEERQQILIEWNATATRYPHDRTIDQLFAEQAARAPDALAVVFGAATLTYQALDHRANQLARYLQTQGIRPESRVAICLERSLDLVVALLAVLKAGAAYVPIDPSYPTERLAYMLADTRTTAVLSTERLLSMLPVVEATVICLDTAADGIAAQPATPPPNTTTPDNLAYVMYTSGSTGRPKGIAVPHRGVVRLVKDTNYVSLTPDDVLLQLAPIAFDAATFEIWGSLLNGARLVVSSPAALTLEQLGTMIQRSGITTLWLTAGLFHQMVDRQIGALGQLRQLLAGGDVLSAAYVERVLRELPGCTFINGYGPTENTTFTCCYVMTGAEQIGGSVPIGTPIANTRVYVLDRSMQPVPIGVPGELYIGGDGLARGYFQRPDLTAEKFVPDPFGSTEDPRPEDNRGARLYRTGDLVRYLPDGNIEFLGRIDQQIKVRGFRIEPGEIETVLTQHPQVRAAAVVAQPDPQGNARLVAYVVQEPMPQALDPVGAADGSPFPKAPSVLGSAELRAFLAARLPDYMVPSAVVLLDTLPLTPNGKLDRKALPAPDSRSIARTTAVVAPRTPLEAQLTAIWQDVLGLSYLSIHDNFFELGGHSLLATQVVARIREQLAATISLHQFFDTPTIAALAQHIAAHQPSSAHDLPPLVPVSHDAPLPLSFAQQRLWFLAQLEPHSTAYTMPILLRLTGSLDPAALHHSLTAVVARHAALRTTFATHHGQPVQIITPPAPVPLPLRDLSALPPTDRTVAVQQHTATAVQQPFDLETGPLLRARLLRLAPDAHLLLLTLHHIVVDGWSLDILLREIAVGYRHARTGDTLDLPPLPIQYPDYAVWQRAWLAPGAAAAVLDRQLAYWRQQLADLPVLQLPTDYPRPPVLTATGARTEVLLPSALRDDLHALSRQVGVTLFMTLLAAWQLVLSRYSGQDDLAVGTPIANRQHLALEPLIGFFVNTLVLRTDLSGPPTLRELLARVRATTLGAYAHQDLPFEYLVQTLQPTRDLSRNPLFQVMFVLQNAPLRAVAVPELTLEPLGIDPGTALFDLTLAVTETEAGLLAALEYNTALFAPETAARLLTHYHTLLEASCAMPDQVITALPLLTEAERQQLLAQWNATAQPYPQDRTIDQLFTEQVARTPNALAVVFEDAALTYQALDQRANQLAHHLRRSGVTFGVRVGVCMERSLDALVALLGIVKAGGTFVPLDPSYPLARLAYMSADSQTTLLLITADSLPVATALVAQLPSGLRGVIALDDTERPHDLAAAITWTTAADIARAPTGRPSGWARAGDVVYIMYTSGSTGQPKGVPIDHHNLGAFFHWNQRYFQFQPDDRIIQFHNLSFDFSTWEIFEAWLAGASLHVVSAAVARDVEALAAYLAAQQITVLNMTPSQFHALAEHVASVAPEALVHLRTVVLGGEMLSAPLAERALAILPHDCRLYNEYGPTEATISCAIRQVTPEIVAEAARAYSVSFGWPIANTQLYVLDRHLQPTPLGVPGELYIGGAGVARYYLNRPDLTAERFLPNPFCEATQGTTGTRVYKTGDLVRYRADGSLEFLGRIDQQVKLRGYRIELSEIEAVLRTHPAIAEVVVLAREDTASARERDARLVAYLVEEPKNKEPNEQENKEPGAHDLRAPAWTPAPTAQEPGLREFLQARLPEYMVPSAFVVLDALPLTPNGKLDRTALPAPDSRSIARSAAFVAPRTDEEAALAEIWAQVLHLDRVSIHDNFFELGGHSLLAVRLMSAIREWSGQTLPLSSLFQAPTIAQLAAQLHRDTTDRPWTPLVTLQPHGAKAPFFCIHPVGGTVLCYAELARSLGSDRPFYALQARGLEPEQTPIDDIPALAAQYLQSIRDIQPQGPYVLGGWSLGGTIAFEMARQLHAQGEQIDLLALIDSSPSMVNATAAQDLDTAALLADFIYDLSGLLGKALPIDVAALRQLEPAEREAYILARAREQGIIPPNIDEDQLRRLARVFQANMQAFQHYQPSPVAVRIDLIQASDSIDTAQMDILDEWHRLALRGVAVHSVPGDHYTLLQQPHIGAVAEWLRARLDDQARHGS